MENTKQLLEKITQFDIQKSEDLPYSILTYLYNRISSKELLHSEIIESFLNPKSEHQCGSFFLFNFFELIEIDKCHYETETEFNIYTEYGIENQRRIDTLITWNGKAVIIENKLNDAVDQKDQLRDYYLSISKEFEVLKIVYIPRDLSKKAPLDDLSDAVRKLVINIYPKDLIKWINNVPINEDVKVSCTSYSNLLKYMNLKNLNSMNANLLLEGLNSNEIKSLVNLSKIVNSVDWISTIFSKIKEKLNVPYPNLRLEIKENRYAEIFHGNEDPFWIELYFNSDYFALWIADKSIEDQAINPAIKNLHFSHDSISKYHYLKNENMHNYKFPSEDKYSKLVEDISKILEVSRLM